MNTNEEKEPEIVKSFGCWYNVCYCIQDRYCPFKESRNNQLNFVYNKLRLDNVNGLGFGNLFFTNNNGQIVVLDWRQIISMIPFNK